MTTSNGEDVLGILRILAKTPSKNEKIELLKIAVGNQAFRDVAYYAYNPYITFGVKPQTDTEYLKADGNIDITNTFVKGLLDSLSARTLTGNKAEDAVSSIISNMDKASAELFCMILNKDLRAGFSKSTLNKVEPGFIPTFDVMLADKYEPDKIKKWPVSVEPKLDGVRVICVVNGDEISFMSRTGRAFSSLETLRTKVKEMMTKAFIDLSMATNEIYFKEYAETLYLSEINNVVIDGEVTSGEFNKTVGDVKTHNQDAKDAFFHIFDVISLSDFTDENKEVGRSYKDRRKLVRYITDRGDPKHIGMTNSQLANNSKEVDKIYEDCRNAGLEGAIVKNLDSKYAKKRSKNWMKIKAEETADIRVIGYYEGEGKYKGMLGGLICDFKGVKVDVGGGYTDEQRRIFMERCKQDSVYFDREHGGKIMGLKGPGGMMNSLIEVLYQEVTPDGSLRHPRFIKTREDKDEL